MRSVAWLSIFCLLLVPAAQASAPHPPSPHAEHAFYRQLCGSVRFTFPVPRYTVYVDEWVNGHEITAWADGPTIIYFFGKNVSGRVVQVTSRRTLVQAVHFIPGCVRLKVAWSRA